MLLAGLRCLCRDAPLPMARVSMCTFKIGRGGRLNNLSAASVQAGPMPRAAQLLCWTKRVPAAADADAAMVVGGQLYDKWLSRTIWVYNATEVRRARQAMARGGPARRPP